MYYWKSLKPTSHETTTQVALLQVIRGLQHWSGGPGAVQISALSEWGPNCEKIKPREYSNSSRAKPDMRGRKQIIFNLTEKEIVQCSVSQHRLKCLSGSSVSNLAPCLQDTSSSQQLPALPSWNSLHYDSVTPPSPAGRICPPEAAGCCFNQTFTQATFIPTLLEHTPLYTILFPSHRSAEWRPIVKCSICALRNGSQWLFTARSVGLTLQND